jgi:hypothetical protein
VVTALAETLPLLVHVARTDDVVISAAFRNFANASPSLQHIPEEVVIVDVDEVVVNGDGSSIRRVRRGRVAHLDVQRVRLWKK